MPSPLITEQQIQNSVVSASGTSWSVSNADASLLRVSSLNGDAATYSYLTVSGTSALKTAAGTLFGITIGNPLTSAIQAWDNTVSGGTTILKFNSNTSAQSFTFGTGIAFSTGLTVSAGSVLDNITFLYK